MKLKYFAILAALASTVSVNAQMTENAIAENGRYKGQTTGVYYDINPDNVSVRTAQLDANTDDPSNVYYIPNNPHSSLNGSITIPDYVNINNKQYPVTEIGNFSFSFNYSISEINLPATITRIGVGAFMRGGINSVNIKNKCIVEKFAFTQTGISSINFDLFTSIGDNAFQDCQKLKEVRIGKTSNLGDYIFKSCDLENVYLDGPIDYIGTNTFKGLNNFKNLIIGDVTTIAESAFEGVRLYTVEFTGSVETIGANAFRNNNLKGDITIKNVKNLGAHAFQQNQDLRGLVTINNVENLGAYCFAATQITGVKVDAVDVIGDHAFYEINDLTYIEIGDHVRIISPCAFGLTVNDSDINGPDINPPTSKTLEYLSIGQRVEIIDDFAFYGRAFKCLVIPDACWKIGDGAFAGSATGYKPGDGCGIQLGKGVRSIGRFAFKKAHIYELTLPENLDYVGEGAFDFIEATSQFTDIFFYDPEPDCDAFSKYAFADWMYKVVTIHVPAGSLEKYFECPAFKRFWEEHLGWAGDVTGSFSDEYGEGDITSAKTTLEGVVGYAFLVPDESIDLNSKEFRTQLDGVEFEWEKWIYDPYDEERYNAIAELSADGKGIVKAKNYGQTIAYAVRSAEHTVIGPNCEPVTEPYDQIVGCAVIFVCPTYTVVYDYNNATANLNDGTTPQNKRAKLIGANGEEIGDGDNGSGSDSGNVVTETVKQVTAENATYQHRVVYNSYPKLLVEPVAGITITQVDRAKDNVTNETVGTADWTKLEDSEDSDNQQILNGQDALTTENADAMFIVPLNPVVEDRVIALINETDTENYTTTDVETVEVGNNISVTVNRFTITINGADDKDVVTVTNMNGQTVYTGLSKTLTMKSQGVYIITVGDTAFKALVR